MIKISLFFGVILSVGASAAPSICGDVLGRTVTTNAEKLERVVCLNEKLFGPRKGGYSNSNGSFEPEFKQRNYPVRVVKIHPMDDSGIQKSQDDQDSFNIWEKNLSVKHSAQELRKLVIKVDSEEDTETGTQSREKQDVSFLQWSIPTDDGAVELCVFPKAQWYYSHLSHPHRYAQAAIGMCGSREMTLTKYLMEQIGEDAVVNADRMTGDYEIKALFAKDKKGLYYDKTLSLARQFFGWAKYFFVGQRGFEGEDEPGFQFNPYGYRFPVTLKKILEWEQSRPPKGFLALYDSGEIELELLDQESTGSLLDATLSVYKPQWVSDQGENQRVGVTSDADVSVKKAEITEEKTNSVLALVKLNNLFVNDKLEVQTPKDEDFKNESKSVLTNIVAINKKSLAKIVDFQLIKLLVHHTASSSLLSNFVQRMEIMAGGEKKVCYFFAWINEGNNDHIFRQTSGFCDGKPTSTFDFFRIFGDDLNLFLGVYKYNQDVLDGFLAGAENYFKIRRFGGEAWNWKGLSRQEIDKKIGERTEYEQYLQVGGAKSPSSKKVIEWSIPVSVFENLSKEHLAVKWGDKTQDSPAVIIDVNLEVGLGQVRIIGKAPHLELLQYPRKIWTRGYYTIDKFE